MAKGPYTASDGRKYVTVVSGDTLSQIAVDYKSYTNNATYKQLAAINNIDNPNKIAIGQTIYLTKKTGSSSSTSKKKTTSSNKAKIKQFGLQANVDRTLLATWTWDNKNTKNYKVEWQYYTKDKVWFTGDSSETTYKYSTYQIPDNATRVRFRVKPISKTYKTKVKSGKTTKEVEKSYWTAEWTDRSKQVFNVSAVPPEEPSSPNVTIDGTKLTARLDNIGSNATKIKFQIVKNDSKVYKTGTATIKTKSSSYSCTIALGNKYKVRCQAVRDDLTSDWSDYSSNVGTVPSTPTKIKYIKALSETSVQLDWTNVSNATGYTVEYTTKKMYFDSGTSEVSSVTVDATAAGHAEITGLTSGEQYFFRVKATNDQGDSGWCPIKSIKIGEEPAAPTTWSSTTTAIVGESLKLYWVHNSEDGSSETSAQLELYIGSNKNTYTLSDSKINNTIITYTPRTTEEKDDGVVGTCSLKTSTFSEGTQIKWRVRTKGILNKWGDWSTQRTVDIYAAPSLELSLLVLGDPAYILTTTQPTDWETNYTSYCTKTDDDEYVHVTGDTAPTWTLNTYYSTQSETTPLVYLSSFPFYVSGIASPETQTPVGYYLTVTSDEVYDTVDALGDPKTVNEGESVYSQYFDTSDDLMVEMSAGNIDLENGVMYTVTCTVSMSSGLTAETSVKLPVSWAEKEYTPNAEIGIDEETYSASIRPYCEEMTMTYYEVTKSNNTYIKTTEVIENDLYEEELRDDYGKIVETTTGEQVFLGTTDEGTELYFCVVTENNLIDDVTLSVYRREFDGGYTEIGKNLDGGTVVTDPHPALDYARYRIVATDKNTGAVSYYDMPNEPVGGIAVIIQWDEEWRTFTASDSTDATDEPPWTGSMLTLPYNIDVSDKYGLDVDLVEYVGRKHPVSYYGTQRGESSSWSVEIEKDDEETLYNLRRLATYAGDVYVREPSGSGYWANVTVSFSQTHCELTIPVTLEITRVEGGI